MVTGRGDNNSAGETSRHLCFPYLRNWTCASRDQYAWGIRSYRQAPFLALLVCCLISGSAAKPKLRVASDGFPTGQDTPEGAASDLARAFMMADTAQFRSVCIRPYGAGPADYLEYLDGVTRHLRQEKGHPSPDDPKTIVRVFSARHLSRNGPASYGYAVFDFQDVMFVDVEVLLHNATSHVRRTMVIRDRDGKWYVHPVPDVSPLLSSGLYDETPSIQLFTDVYEVEH